jgi:hypothetical protein
MRYNDKQADSFGVRGTMALHESRECSTLASMSEVQRYCAWIDDVRQPTARQLPACVIVQADLLAAAQSGVLPASQAAANTGAAAGAVAGGRAPAHLASSSETDQLMAALASAGSLTEDQQSILQEFFDPQDDDSSSSGSDSDSGSDDDQQASAAADSTGAQAASAGVGVSVAAAGVGVSTAAAGVAVAAELPAEGQPAADNTATKVKAFKDALHEPLWKCNGADGQCSAHCAFSLHKVIFMLMSWKIEHCVRDAAFAALLECCVRCCYQR